MPTAKPRKHLLTRLGLVALFIVLLDFSYVTLHQKIETGAFFPNPAPWVSPTWTRVAMLAGVPISLLLLLIGSVIDSVRYGRWRKATDQPRDEVS